MLACESVNELTKEPTMSAGQKSTDMREYKMNNKWFLAFLVAFAFLWAGCHGGHHGSDHRSRATATPTGSGSPTPTASRTGTATPTHTSTTTATATATASPIAPAPMVISSNPALSGCGGQGVPINRKVAVSFNEAMDPTTITQTTFTLEGPGSTPIPGTVSYDTTNNIAIFTPNGGLLPAGATITGNITIGAESATHVPLANDYMWTFATGADSDTAKPTVISTNPADLGSAPTNQKINATFSEGMDSTTITGSTFTLKGPGSTPVTGTVTYSAIGASATFRPSSALATGVMYTATITVGAKDLAGNPLAAAYSWTFTAGLGPDSTAPTVTFTSPANGASAVAPNSAINATFSSAMDPSALNPATFTLTGPGPTSIAGKVTYDATNQIATFTPTSALATGASYIATVTTGAKSLTGVALAANFPWSFSAGSTAGLLPVNLGAAAGFQVLAQATITNTGASMINGDIGLAPGTSVIGFPPGVVNGSIEVNTPPATAALAALATAYGDAAGRSGPTLVNENLAGQILSPGLYTSAATSFEITGGNLTLDAQGDPNAVWIFQMPASTLTLTAPNCSVILMNGAQFSNIFWQVGSSATIGSGCVLEGNILANTSITMVSGATVNGKLLAGAVSNTGAVTLDTNSASTAGGCDQ